MKTIAVTQKVTKLSNGETCDLLDQRWAAFLEQAGLIPLLIPNRVSIALQLVEQHQPNGILLTGGNDLCSLGGDAEERDLTELSLFEWAAIKRIPVLGVCRGMQFLQSFYQIPLYRVEGHVRERVSVTIDGKIEFQRGYHHFGTKENSSPFEVWAVAEDGVVKAIRTSDRLIQGVMWHPERCEPHLERDITFFRQHFAGSSPAVVTKLNRGKSQSI